MVSESRTWILVRLDSDEANILRLWIKSTKDRADDSDLKQRSDAIISEAFARGSFRLKGDSSIGSFRFDLYKEGMLIPEDLFMDPPLEAERFDPEEQA